MLYIKYVVFNGKEIFKHFKIAYLRIVILRNSGSDFLICYITPSKNNE